MEKNKSSSFTIDYHSHVRVLRTEVLISPAFDPAKEKTPSLKKIVAILDTGASNTVISTNIVKKYALMPINVVKTYTASGERLSNVYLIWVGLPNYIAFPMLKVTDGDLPTGDDMLIGMDIIGAGDFAVTNKDNNTIATYRYPSITRIDFVKGSKHPPVKRNDPCPCGSGVKYKKCCGQ